jgi:predicted GNAT family acetyltransferase
VIVDDDLAPGSVVDDLSRRRLAVVEGDEVAELVYQIEGDRLILIHTGVPDAFRGRGIGGELVRAALDKAQRQGLVVVPWCPFARKWLKEHEEKAAGVVIDFKTMPPGHSGAASAPTT